jgi:hypothetical protein
MPKDNSRFVMYPEDVKKVGKDSKPDNGRFRRRKPSASSSEVKRVDAHVKKE